MGGTRVHNLLLSIGAVLIIIGGVWALQGIGLIPGSFMTGRLLWLVIGSIFVLAGVGCVGFGLSGRPARR